LEVGWGSNLNQKLGRQRQRTAGGRNPLHGSLHLQPSSRDYLGRFPGEVWSTPQKEKPRLRTDIAEKGETSPGGNAGLKETASTAAGAPAPTAGLCANAGATGVEAETIPYGDRSFDGFSHPVLGGLITLLQRQKPSNTQGDGPQHGASPRIISPMQGNWFGGFSIC